MAVPAIGALQSAAKIEPIAASGVGQAQPKTSFQEILNGAKNKDLHSEINQLQQHLINNRDLAPRELLLYQIKVSRLGMQVELVSKVSEALISTTRRLQNSQ